MERTLARELSTKAGRAVTLRGWLQHRRDLVNVAFVILRDRTGTAQIALSPTEASALSGIGAESALEVSGIATAEPRAPGGVEVRKATVSVIAASISQPPFELWRPNLNAALPTILDHSAVSLRHLPRRAAFRIMHVAVDAFRDALRQQGFTEVFTPKIVATATESGANCFPVDYFGERAFLAQSPQLYKQMLVGIFERVFEVGPVFRAEPHDTPRHLNEYVSLDAEIGFIADHQDVMAVLESAVRGMASAAAGHADSALAGVVPVQAPTVFPTVQFTDALRLLAPEFGAGVRDEPDFAPGHERWLGEWAMREYASDLLFVTGFPMSKRPFYTCPDPSRPAYSNSFDLLFRGLEIATGGQRLHVRADYDAALAARGIDPMPFAGYLEAFEYGMPPHGGFALGLERFVRQLVRAADLRETTLFPRDVHRLMP